MRASALAGELGLPLFRIHSDSKRANAVESSERRFDDSPRRLRRVVRGAAPAT
jgi:hypothetical protein